MTLNHRKVKGCSENATDIHVYLKTQRMCKPPLQTGSFQYVGKTVYKSQLQLIG